ncbi:hypothetical protein DQM68_10045 [Leptospira mayottensis]|uniref:Uncharacterized protein n=1 Tax=Leptospira mayottensis TaxID=1137606 RepID=A0ABN5NVV6_9LEPT|nr:hypothetical protein DQM68_10045 [Leptospira mayottensis]AXR64847.1 hypothetical protein DQM28_12085 [Leptospira mayottensis]AZQ02589.1 hypothetical protein LEP1GSC190_11640 [Leptospira mayottensis 200901116]
MNRWFLRPVIKFQCYEFILESAASLSFLNSFSCFRRNCKDFCSFNEEKTVTYKLSKKMKSIGTIVLF